MSQRNTSHKLKPRSMVSQEHSLASHAHTYSAYLLCKFSQEHSLASHAHMCTVRTSYQLHH